jgi:hypothetical protein
MSRGEFLGYAQLNGEAEEDVSLYINEDGVMTAYRLSEEEAEEASMGVFSSPDTGLLRVLRSLSRVITTAAWDLEPTDKATNDQLILLSLFHILYPSPEEREGVRENWKTYHSQARKLVQDWKDLTEK